MNRLTTFEPLRPYRFPKEIVKAISAMILTGQLPPNTRLPSERELAAQFKVSRPTVREAIHALEALGAVEVHHGSGIYVRKNPLPVSSPLLEDILEKDLRLLFEVFDVRCELEIRNAELAAQQATEEEINGLGAIVTRMGEEMTAGRSGFQQDIDFHITVAEASHNRFRLSLTTSVLLANSELIRQVREKILNGHTHFPNVFLREIEAIYLAIREKCPQKAKDTMYAHLMACLDRYHFFLDGREG